MIKNFGLRVKKTLFLTILGISLCENNLKVEAQEKNVIVEDTNDKENEVQTVHDCLNSTSAGINMIFNSIDVNSYTLDELKTLKITNLEEKLAKDYNIETLTLLNNEKIAALEEKYNLTSEEFNIFACVMIKESKAYDVNADNYDACYTDCYHTTSAFYNRTQSITWRTYIDKVNYEGAGASLYGQVTAPGQSEVYEKGYYEDILDTDKNGDPRYQAVIDMLFSEEPSNDYLCFRAASSDPKGKEQFVKGGNRFLINSLLTEEDRYIEEKKDDLTLKLTQ